MCLENNFREIQGARKGSLGKNSKWMTSWITDLINSIGRGGAIGNQNQEEAHLEVAVVRKRDLNGGKQEAEMLVFK